MNIYIGLPAYNEERSIKPLFERISRLSFSLNTVIYVVVYDDGCKDKTKSEVMSWNAKMNLIYIDGIVNRGLGAGMNALLQKFNEISSDEDVLVIMDCDDTHDPEQIHEMIKVLEKNIDTGIVVASRYRYGAKISGVPVHRILLSICAALLYKLVHPIFGNPIIKERGFACMVEVLLKMAKSGAKVREIPLKLAYDNKLSLSKMDVSGNSFRLLNKLITWRLKGLK
jgi:dolichol-phosphate mannosyltransferase